MRLIPMLPVRSLAASVAFYEKLGFQVENRRDDWGWAMLRRDDCRLMLDQSINAHPDAPRQGVLYLYPDDIAAYHRQVRANGLDVPDLDRTFYGMTEFRLDDPDGNRLWIGQGVATRKGTTMGVIPDDARWYLADVILEHRVAGDPRNVVHVNTHLVAAGSPEEAYAKALDLGRSSEQAYENTDGRPVRVIFRGLRALDVIHDPLEDGAELMYAEGIGVPERRLRSWARPKEHLAVFAPRQAGSDKPNMLPREFRGLVPGPDHGERDESAEG